MSARTLLALTGAVVLVALMFAACATPVQPFVASEAGVIQSMHSTPTDTTFVLEDGQQLTFGAGVRWLNGILGEGDLLLAGTSPTPWAATLPVGPRGLQPCFSVPGTAWDRGDHIEIAFGTNDGPVTLRVAKAPTWISPKTTDTGELDGTFTCLDANGDAVARG